MDRKGEVAFEGDRLGLLREDSHWIHLGLVRVPPNPILRVLCLRALNLLARLNLHSTRVGIREKPSLYPLTPAL